jgi:hypothetical protein
MAEPEEVFAGNGLGLTVLARVRDLVAEIGPAQIRTSRTQVAFRRRQGFAYLWDPGRWLTTPHADVVLSIALPEHVASPRWKEVVHPSSGVWMHHLEVKAVDDLDTEVATWLAAAYASAA